MIKKLEGKDIDKDGRVLVPIKLYRILKKDGTFSPIQFRDPVTAWKCYMKHKKDQIPKILL